MGILISGNVTTSQLLNDAKQNHIVDVGFLRVDYLEKILKDNEIELKLC